MTAETLLLASLGIALGGFLKGATGAGAPVVGVPVLALVFGVPKAVAIFAVINLLSNVWQGWSYRRHAAGRGMVATFALAGGVGVVLGSFLLAWLPTELLMGALSAVVFLYVGLRLARPDWTLPRESGRRMAPGAGLVGGLMQGAGGISAPVSVTFLNAMRLPREEFIATIAVFFVTMSAFQVVALSGLGVLTWDRVALALAAMPAMFLAMAVGERAARRWPRHVFDRAVLVLLVVVALRLGYAAVF